MSNIIDTIKDEDLSLEELGEIVKESLSKMYSQLRNELGMHEPIGIIKSIGDKSYYVSISFIESESSSGESYEQVYHI